jgi:hypothetical protein
LRGGFLGSSGAVGTARPIRARLTKKLNPERCKEKAHPHKIEKYFTYLTFTGPAVAHDLLTSHEHPLKQLN